MAISGVTGRAIAILGAALVASGCTIGGVDTHAEPDRSTSTSASSSAPSSPSGPTSSSSPTRADAAGVLEDGIAGLREREHGSLTHVVLYEGAAYIDIRAGYHLDDPSADIRVRAGNPLEPSEQQSGRLVIDGDDALARGFGILGGECWVPVPPRVLADSVGTLGRGLGDLLLLDRMQAVRWTPMNEVVEARLPADLAWQVFAPNNPKDLRGSVPVEVTVVDGTVLEWTMTGPDMWAVIDRQRPEGWRRLGFVWDASFSARFEDTDPGDIALPDDDVATSAAAGCASQGRTV